MTAEPLTLTKIDGARRALAEARDLADVKNIHDQAEAIRQYGKAQGWALEAQNSAAEIALVAERRGGELLKAMRELGQRQDRGRPQKTLHDETISSPDPAPTLADLGLTRVESHRWQQIADIPEPVFEQHVAETKARGEELTTAGVIRAAKAVDTEQAKTEAQTMARAIDNMAEQSPEVMTAHTKREWSKATVALYAMTNLDAARVADGLDALDVDRNLDCIRQAVAWLQSLDFEITNGLGVPSVGGLIAARSR